MSCAVCMTIHSPALLPLALECKHNLCTNCYTSTWNLNRKCPFCGRGYTKSADQLKYDPKFVPLNITVSTLTGARMLLGVTSMLTVGALKEVIAERQDTPPEYIKLAHGKHPLTDEDRTLGECKVANNSTIHVVTRFKGGRRSTSS